ncbi:hypothetical protein B0H14DRAFT_3714983 [Mycena olivaceomarginata]|nr:hypothetical protein B0H14DRAFT_3714983 [Mycena olivaceomarginata]
MDYKNGFSSSRSWSGEEKPATPIEQADSRVAFWNVYKPIADEYDKEIIERSRSELKNSLIFAGLFSAVVTSVIGLSSDNDPDDSPFSDPFNFKVQLALYLVLSTIMAAAFFSVLAQQYLMDY